ncbi:MAG TPA: nuclear transport factor 2 family protein [Gemmatimonadaceae bacterium]|nr:nuclear transport factor 2 family protein [Gemmatimonadaceae bacterium]
MMLTRRVLISLTLIAGAACSQSKTDFTPEQKANFAIDSLNVRLSAAYHNRDPRAYAALFTDSAVFEWPAFNSPRGPTQLANMARDNWSAERDVELQLNVSMRRLATDHATEFGAFQQAWTDSSGARMIEYGRYATYLVRSPDGRWRMERWLGFEDSTRRAR